MSIEKDKSEILNKLGIDNLNKMQFKSHQAIQRGSNVLLLSPTGTGKTVGFLLPIFENLDPNQHVLQFLIMVPSRELATQIEQVARDMGAGLKINSVYGGQKIYKDKENLEHTPHVLIGTPGRLADHIKRETIGLNNLKYVVLDEYDKSLEIGFEKEMTKIMELVDPEVKRILTSATKLPQIPDFVNMESYETIDFLHQKVEDLYVEKITSPEKDKLETLADSLQKLQGKRGIVFANFKDSIDRISDFLKEKKIPHDRYYGGMEQQDRERALIQFRNGSTKVLLATDLAARGLDVPELDFIIHYHIPIHAEEFTHRNGRTARMHESGVAYVIIWQNDKLPEFIPKHIPEAVLEGRQDSTDLSTVFISGGRKDNISKGDIAGFFYKNTKLGNGEVGHIELLNDCAFVAVPSNKSHEVVKVLNNQTIKKRKLRVYKI